MNIQAQKIELMKMIIETENISILERIKSLFVQQEGEDFWLGLSSEQKSEIMIGIDDVETGNTVDYEDFMRKHR